MSAPPNDGRLVVDDHQQTTVPGLFAAGDLVRGLNQISTAQGEAAIAATAMHNRLRDLDRAAHRQEPRAARLLSEDAYRSSNGDRWQVLHDASTGRTVVRHEPNLSCGGIASETEVEDFLSVNGSGPEYAAVRRLLAERRGDDNQPGPSRGPETA